MCWGPLLLAGRKHAQGATHRARAWSRSVMSDVWCVAHGPGQAHGGAARRTEVWRVLVVCDV